MRMTKQHSSTHLNDLIANPFSTKEATDATKTPAKQDNSPVLSKKTYDNLSKDNQHHAQEIAQKLTNTDYESVMHYGAAAQEKIGEFSHAVLKHVQTQETGHIGETLNDLMYQLQSADPDELKAEDANIFKKIFGKINRSIYETTAKYQKIGAQVDKIAGKLTVEKDALLKNNQMLADLYDQNLEFYDALNIYIAAGELRLEELHEDVIPSLTEQAQQSDNQMLVQEVNDLHQFQSRLEKRVHDLKIARQLTIQQAPQIRLIQNTNQELAEKIQTSINTAIPLWKNQVVIALTLLRQKEASTAQRQVSETTNDMLKKNSELLKQSSIETARENERGIVDIETLQHTQANLIETLEETLQIQQEGRQKRQAIETELHAMENSLRNQLLTLSED